MREQPVQVQRIGERVGAPVLVGRVAPHRDAHVPPARAVVVVALQGHHGAMGQRRVRRAAPAGTRAGRDGPYAAAQHQRKHTGARHATGQAPHGRPFHHARPRPRPRVRARRDPRATVKSSRGPFGSAGRPGPARAAGQHLPRRHLPGFAMGLPRLTGQARPPWPTTPHPCPDPRRPRPAPSPTAACPAPPAAAG
jgi:hypothetical protein